MRILFDGPVARTVKKENTAQMVNKSLKHRGNFHKTPPGTFLLRRDFHNFSVINQFDRVFLPQDSKNSPGLGIIYFPKRVNFSAPGRF
jgi:hypothetical protein